MELEENVSLAPYSTMRLGGSARYLAQVKTEDNMRELVLWAKSKRLPVIMVGTGSNIVWRDEGFGGLVLVNQLKGREVLSQDDESALVKIAAGENWDESVAWTVGQNLSGIEYMSLIPGTAGAAPVQNVGAYGGELSETLVEVEAYDTQNDCFLGIMNQSCDFTYRGSRFKSKDKHRFLITAIVLRLKKANPQPPFYESLQNYFDEHGIKEFTPQVVRQAVMAIRPTKLPDPSTVANNGSFFTNPFVEPEHFKRLQRQFPDIKGWPQPDGKVKVSAGWLVEQAGFKGVRDDSTGMATWDANALVLVNEHARATKDLLEFRQKIIFKVDELFGIVLEQEPELLP